MPAPRILTKSIPPVATASSALVLWGCGGGGSEGRATVNVPPSLSITHPATDAVVSRGWQVSLAYVDEDPDDIAATRLFADTDGDSTTTNDQYPLTEWRLDQDGASQELVSDLSGVPEGKYWVIGVTADGRNTPVQARAPGNLIVSSVAWATRARSNLTLGGVATFADGSSVLTGSFQGTATFGPGEPRQKTLTASGDYDTFVARHAANGSFEWAMRAGGPETCLGGGIVALPDGSTVVTGSFSERATFGEGEANETTLISAGEVDVFVARYAADGALVWVKRAGGGSYDVGHGIVLFPDGSSMVAGAFRDRATFGPGEARETVLTSSRGIAPDLFLARYAPDGSLDWVIGAGEGAGLTSSIAGLPDGSTVLAGSVHGSVTLGPRQPGETRLTASGGQFDQDVFVARYGPDGSLAWAKRAGGESLEQSHGIAAFSDGSSVITGFFRGTATFGEGGPHQTVLEAVGDADIFIARYAADGSLTWARRAGSPARMTDYSDQGRDVAAMADGSAVVTGEFSLTATFGEGEPRQSILYSNGFGGLANAFVARYAPDGSLAWAKRVGCLAGSGGAAVAGHADGSVVVAGRFFGTATFGPGELNPRVINDGSFATFVARFNADGGF